MGLGLCFGEANSKVPAWFPGDHYASGGDRDRSQHPQCSHERLPPLCSEAGHGVSVSRAGDSLTLVQGFAQERRGDPCVPSSATPLSIPQPAKLGLEGSVPYCSKVSVGALGSVLLWLRRWPRMSLGTCLSLSPGALPGLMWFLSTPRSSCSSSTCGGGRSM